jgi:organic hydroperoxide reductase OsmC/OhrA
MSDYTATVIWRRGGDQFRGGRYSRAHLWSFDGGVDVPASASPHVVPRPLSVENAVDPEEAFVASISSCHMLWFLSLAAKGGFVVESYSDHARGTMAPDDAGRMVFASVTLHPRTRFAPDARPTPAELESLHHRAHAECYIANSVKCRITTVPAFEDGEGSDS